MQIILLSGGSGKRLWPLSNGIRSKQFIKLLESPQGQVESILQRLFRQIREANIKDDITVATSALQRDSIISQLREEVDIVTEPEYRDTFPAIALSASYLYFEKGCEEDEIVLVMPSDSYVESQYFEVVGQIKQLVKEKVADLVLMGITPSAPSTKFGYIVPVKDKGNKGYYTVSRFTEKPDEDNARRLLDEQAYWNGGVFAFRLGYIMNIIRQYIHTDSFKETCDRYSELPKISFDYEIVEKASSVAMVPYSGKWKDLGTWDTLSEELPKPFRGNVITHQNVESTTVINELDIPIVCSGLKDLVIVGSQDGILVSSKADSETLESTTEKIESRPMYEERRWGDYKVLQNATYEDGCKCLTKEIHLAPGKNISYQVHHHRSETWTIVDGEGLLVLDGQTTRVTRDDVIHIKKEQKHAIKALTDLYFIEVQLGDNLVEEDIDRMEWDWEK